MKEFQTIHEAYLSVLSDVYFREDFRCKPRDQWIKECVDYQFKILEPQVEAIRTLDPKRNRKIESYTEKEMELYDSCSNDAKDFAAAASFWDTIKNPDGTVNSAYGYLIWENESFGNPKFDKDGMRTPWEWAVESLKKDKDTRQAFIKFSLPEHQWMGNKDQTCTMHGNFLIRDNKLNLSIVMRSNDVVLGLAYDMPWFISLIYKMKNELSDTYPLLNIGTYSHLAHSLHIYERDFKKVEKMLGMNDESRTFIY